MAQMFSCEFCPPFYRTPPDLGANASDGEIFT